MATNPTATIAYIPEVKGKFNSEYAFVTKFNIGYKNTADKVVRLPAGSLGGILCSPKTWAFNEFCYFYHNLELSMPSCVYHRLERSRDQEYGERIATTRCSRPSQRMILEHKAYPVI